MVENSKENIDKAPEKEGLSYWRPVMLFYVKTTSWIIFPLILGALAGKYVSKSVGSQVLFFVFLMLGFLVTCFGIYREIKEYKRDLEKK